MKKCSFCEALEIHKQVEKYSDKGITRRHRATLLVLTSYNGNEAGRGVDYISDGKGCPLNYCPECGKKLNEI